MPFLTQIILLASLAVIAVCAMPEPKKVKVKARARKEAK